MKSQTLTFCQLIEQHGCISIPMLQRDYAQGRDSAAEVRGLFLEALCKALGSNEVAVTLDFIYGSTDNRVFSPLDGQQRLTTLFLLHWYLAQKEGKQDDFQKLMKRGDSAAFTYETRPSSRNFFNELTRYKPKAFSESEPPSVQIQDQVWFMSAWLDDPTIRSALQMLDAMHSSQYVWTKGAYDKLVSATCPITFHCLDIGTYPHADDLYVKMNARGKPLTAFESLKARLEEKIGGLFPDEVELPNGEKGTFKTYFSQHIDRDWLDFFWNFNKHQKAEDKEMVPDGIMMKLVREVAILALVLETDEVENKNLTLLRDPKRTPTPHDYEKVGSLNETFVTLFSVLLQRWSGEDGKFKTYLSADKCPFFKEEDILNDILNEDEVQTYTRSAMFYGYAFYLERHQGLEIDPARFSEWMRVVHNLVENTRCNDETSFKKCLNGVRTLADQADDILKYLAEDDSGLAAFDDYQVKEEKLKARLMLRNPIWRDPILDAEKHGYFRGQIGFLFRFSGIESGRTAEACLTDFVTWWQKSAHCFSDNGAKQADFLWERGLLATGDYLLDNGTHLLKNDLSADYNWKRLLRGKDVELKQSEIMQDLIGSIDHKRPLEDQLEAIIKTALERADLEEWRKLMIQRPEAIRFCSERRIRREEEGKRIVLLKREDRRGHWAEIWSYALHLELKKHIASYSPFHEADYHMARKDESCAYVVWRSGEGRFGDVALSVERQGEGAKLTFLRWHGEPIDMTMIQVIEGLGFKMVEGGRCEISINDKSNVENFIKDVAGALRGFQPVNCANE